MQQEQKCVANKKDIYASDSLFKNQSLTRNNDDLFNKFKTPDISQLITCSRSENTSHSYSYNDLKF